jgi:hypothetical protein
MAVAALHLAWKECHSRSFRSVDLFQFELSVSFNGDFLKAQSLKSRKEEKHINQENTVECARCTLHTQSSNILREHLVSEDSPVTSSAKRAQYFGNTR